MIKSKLPAIALTAFVYCLPVFSSLVPMHYFDFSSKAYAQDGEKKRIKVPAIRNRVYTQFARAQTLADEGDRAAGFEVLDDVKARIDGLNSYERAMLFNFYGFMYYGNEDSVNAMKSFEQVVAQDAIPESLRLSTLYALSQLAMQQEDYKKALAYLKQWQQLNAQPLTANQEVLFAQVYYQDQQYQNALDHIAKAVTAYEAENKTPKESWLILQRAAFFELKQPENVTLVMEKLVRLYDKPQYWLQLGAMYGEIGEEKKQLGVMEAAWQAGYIQSESDIVSLAQLYLYHEIPYKAADLLNVAIAQGKVTANEKYYELLAQSYALAKEDDKAIPVLIQASNVADSGKFDAQLAQSYLNTDQWQLAITAANSAIERGGVDNLGYVYLVLGMAHFNLNAFDPSLNAFEQAQTFAQTKKVASQWQKYVSKEKQHQAQLKLVMNQ